ncbi:minichromosome maintenance protein MCM [Halosimplex pelagicum]|uniref:DNA helicase n=1 Tax=Halosimplex pelagicum TaxID=869886 RepID=A0A7D5PE07_9EURY|nr:minichromosome maintenance protein MCM [Halosimplex pelagicum]QLH80959.1 minichromosome maintenance protein MCM [Halosimplex pelagicum]
MTTTNSEHTAENTELVEQFLELYRDYYREEMGTLAQHYPQEQQALNVDYHDIFRYDPDLADDYLAHPEQVRAHAEDALVRYDLPVDVKLGDARARVHNLPDDKTHFPGEFSPSDHDGVLRSIRGEIKKATDPYSQLEEAAFECQRCGTLTRIPQRNGHYQEPHECQSCERQGPFRINRDQSEFIDGQKLRIQTPPEYAQGEGQDIDVFVTGDLTNMVTAGDRATVTGIIKLEQQSQGNQDTAKFEPYVDGQHIAVEQTDAEDLDISAETREQIKALAGGEQGDPLELAAETLAPKIYGYDIPKRAIVLSLVGGAHVEYQDGDFDRGQVHILLIGDPSTGKSKLVDRAEGVGWRAVGVSGTGATVAGVTATAVQDDFGDGSWTLDAGAAVKAHRGVLAIDELDDMPPEVRAALLEPMSKQSIHITKGGINTHLQTRIAAIAAANPKHGRFDPYEPVAEQFAFDSALLSRFDLVYTFRDKPDEDEDDAVAHHVLTARDAAKRNGRDMDSLEDSADPQGPIEVETLRAWIALAKRQPDPVFADESVEESIRESWLSLRGLYDYDESEPVPVTFRSLEGIVRVAEAAARFELSETIEQRHVDIATELVGQSMQDIGRDEDGNLDADVKETGGSKAQKDRKKEVINTIQERQSEGDDGMAEIDAVVEELAEHYDRARVEKDIDSLLYEKGVATEPKTGHIRYIGGY